MAKKRNILVANWKMNPSSSQEARVLFQKIRNTAKKLKQTDVVVAPSFVHIPLLSKLVPSKNTSLGSQTCHQKDFGPFTGEVSPASLKEYKVKYVILGHSERRLLGETDHMIREKIETSLRFGISPIVCIGEKERDHEGSYFDVVRGQLVTIFSGLQKKHISDCIIAYEPSWVIGHTYKDSLSGTDMHEMSLFIRKTMSEIFGRDYGWNVRIIYGGSVEVENTPDLLEKGDISGLLIGHASLEIDVLKKILSIVDSYK